MSYEPNEAGYSLLRLPTRVVQRHVDQQQQDDPNGYKRFFHGSSNLVQPVIIFSETQVGLSDAHTVANLPSGLVALSATKSVTYS